MDKIAIVRAKIQRQISRDNFYPVYCILIDMFKVFKLCQHCHRMAAGVYEKLLHSKSVSLQHVDSHTGYRKGGRSAPYRIWLFT